MKEKKSQKNSLHVRNIFLWYLCVCIWSVQQDLNTYLKYDIIPFELAYVYKYKEKHSAVRFKKSYFIMHTKWPFWCSKCSGGGYYIYKCQLLFLATQWKFNLLVGIASIQAPQKISRINDLEKLPHTLSLTLLIILLYFVTVSMHMIINFTTSDLCFSCFFSHYHSSWLLLLQWWWVQLLCVPLRMVNFELWPGETWTLKGETLSSHVISVMGGNFDVWILRIGKMKLFGTL